MTKTKTKRMTKSELEFHMKLRESVEKEMAQDMTARVMDQMGDTEEFLLNGADCAYARGRRGFIYDHARREAFAAKAALDVVRGLDPAVRAERERMAKEAHSLVLQSMTSVEARDRRRALKESAQALVASNVVVFVEEP